MGLSHSPSLVTDGLVLCLDAGNPKSYPGSGTAWGDVSGRKNNATLNGGVSYSSENGGILGFDGTDDYCSIATTVALGNPCSLFSFFRLSASNSDTVIYGPWANGNDNWLGINTNRIFMYGTETTDVNNFSLVGTTTLNTSGSVWYSVCSVINGQSATLYLNDRQEATTTRTFTIGGWSSLASIGRRGSASQRYFLGSIGVVLGYSAALSAEQVRQNYAALRGRFGL